MEAQSQLAIYRRTGWILIVLAGALLSAALSALSPGLFWPGWLAFAVLVIPGQLALRWAWGWAGSGRALGWMIALAFLLRLAAGIGMSYALPIWGYDQPAQRAGYLFKDAFHRDQQAWKLAQSQQPLTASFQEEFFTDQYGGLLALSALIYRYTSPDAHRPFLVLALGTLVFALGVPFLVQAARRYWGGRVAVLAGWILALFPEGIFFSSSQMREPFLIGLGAVAFWAVLSLESRRRAAGIALAASLAVMAVISSRVAVALTGFLALLFLVEYVVGRRDRRWQVSGWLGLLVGGALLLAFSWEWFESSVTWDVSLTKADSGWVAKLVQEASEMTGLSKEKIILPAIVSYGLARPVLPAAIAEPAESALWKAIAITRSTAWYLLAPFLIYGVFSVWKEGDPEKRRRLIWLALMVVLWLIIASARGGGDAVDNPRYRMIFIPWMALLAAWAVDWALARRDAWLWRWILVEAIFLGFFTNWYFSRYFHLWQRLPFWHMAAWIAGLTGLVLVSGWVWDRARAGKRPFLPKNR